MIVFVPLILAGMLWIEDPPAVGPTAFPILIRLEHPPTPEEIAVLAKTGVSGYVVAASHRELEQFERDPVPLVLDGIADRGELCWEFGDYERSFQHYLVTRDPVDTERRNC